MTGAQTKQKAQKPELLWGRLSAVTALFVADPAAEFCRTAYLRARNKVANVIQAFETSSIDHDAWGKRPLNNS
jgi:hypothetical protein